MIWCPPGGFIMGPSILADSPAHPVILTQGFYLGKYEVSQGEYQKIMGVNPSGFKGDELPVEKINWNDAMEFCETLSKIERRIGWKFSLPSSAEWEYACRAGTTTLHSWGDNITPQLANYADSGLNKTAEVGSYRPNPWGFHNLHGNVWEWVLDRRAPYTRNVKTDPLALSGSGRVFRGGSWLHTSMHLASGYRNGPHPTTRSHDIGFRVAFKQMD
jgi:formylglycine-generating enzyme required for sulfatase activity